MSGKSLGINVAKGAISFCLLGGAKSSPIFHELVRHKFDADQARPIFANFCKQTFNEVINKFEPNVVSYRASINAGKADQVAYLCHPFGILNLLAHERDLKIKEYTTSAFTKKALGYSDDKFAACDSQISNRPAKWDQEHKLAALAAWMSLDV